MKKKVLFTSILIPTFFVGLFVPLAITGCHNESNKKEAAEVIEADINQLAEIKSADTVPAAPAKTKFEDTEEAEEFLQNSEDSDRYTVGIFPRMAKDNPDYLAKLLDNCEDGFIIVDKGRMKVVLYDSYGKEIKEYGMACSRRYGTKHKRGDNRTPEGFFSIEGIYNSTDWLYTDDNGVTSKKKGQFGPRFIRLLIPGTSAIGIHGTCAPWSIGGRSSHGCIRLTNENILDLVDRVKTGMPVIVVPGKKDYATNVSEGHHIPWVASVPDQIDPRSKADRELTAKKETVTPGSTHAKDTINIDSAIEVIQTEDQPLVSDTIQSPE